ncbi:related to DUF domain protein [Cephalotrichum gorgonifer]|uniref:Related to DUF domain protein n=1 Tax=Cephalotrichum gorgonifer TaxID=2041049 RepID=A0AAE8MQY4_9PEZI|nr:related to DUF domain protein [Cephalotrichum gorgonifer]
MAIVSNAIVLSFHLKSQPSELEMRMSKPLGIVFWALSLCCLGLGAGNYITTVNKYGGKVAIVQSGWKTQVVLGAISVSIVGTCVVLLIIAKISGGNHS